MILQIILSIINLGIAILIFKDENSTTLSIGIGVIFTLWTILYFLLVFTCCRARGNPESAFIFYNCWKIYYFFQLFAFIISWALFISNNYKHRDSNAGIITASIISILIEALLFTHYLSVVHSWCLKLTDEGYSTFN